MRRRWWSPATSASPASARWWPIRPPVRSRSCAGRRRAGARWTTAPATRAATTEGLFEFAWRGDTLYARNNAVGDAYLFGWSTWPEDALADGPARPRERALIWRANYHPDGGQMIWPMHGESFVVPLAPPGDDVTPGSFTSFWCDGMHGLYVRPGVWHGAFVPHADTATFLDRQGRVHARVSVDFPKEFGCHLAAPLRRPQGA